MLVASLADHSLAAVERAAAEALVATCGPCADLFTDLEALRVATQAQPVPARPRDFRLTADDAVRMRPGGWRRFVAAFGSSRDMLSRPLAAGLTTIGLAGLLVATSAWSSGAGSSPVRPAILPTATGIDAGRPCRRWPHVPSRSGRGTDAPPGPRVAPSAHRRRPRYAPSRPPVRRRWDGRRPPPARVGRSEQRRPPATRSAPLRPPRAHGEGGIAGPATAKQGGLSPPLRPGPPRTRAVFRVRAYTFMPHGTPSRPPRDTASPRRRVDAPRARPPRRLRRSWSPGWVSS